MGENRPEDVYVLLLRAFCVSQYGVGTWSPSLNLPKIYTGSPCSLCLSFIVEGRKEERKNDRKTDRQKERNPFPVITVSSIWQSPPWAAFTFQRCAHMWPTEVRWRAEMIKDTCLLFHWTLSCRWRVPAWLGLVNTTHMFHIYNPLLFTLRACTALFMLPRRFIEFLLRHFDKIKSVKLRRAMTWNHNIWLGSSNLMLCFNFRWVLIC